MHRCFYIVYESCYMIGQPAMPNQSPTFASCNGPGNEEYFADWGTHSTVVTWNTPTANDPEEGQLQYVLFP